MTYQYPLSVRYDEEGRPDGLKETLNVVVSSISATNWAGLPSVGGGIAVSDAEVGQIYFRENDSQAAGIALPASSGYLFASATEAGISYSWSDPPGTGVTPVTVLDDLEDVDTDEKGDGYVLAFNDTTDLWEAVAPPDLTPFVRIDDAAPNQIYVNNDTGTNTVGIVNNQVGYLYWNGAAHSFQNPPGTEYPTENSTSASVWYLSGISGIAVSAATSVAVTRSVFTAARQVIYSSETNNNPIVTNSGSSNEVLAVNEAGNAIDFVPLNSLPFSISVQNTLNSLGGEIDSVSARVNTLSGEAVFITDVAAGQIYYRADEGPTGVPSPQMGKFLRFNGTSYEWATPEQATSPPVENLLSASLWYLSGISSIALSATSSVAVTRSVFTASRQVPYSTAANSNPSVTTQGGLHEVLAVTNVTNNTIDFVPLTDLPLFSTLDADLNTVSARINTLSGETVFIKDAEINRIYYRSAENTAAGVAAPINGTFLKYTTDGGYVWETPEQATSPPIEVPLSASLWYLSGISSIALSATSSVAVTRSVFTAARQVIYSSETNNNPIVTTAGTSNQVLTVNGNNNAVIWEDLDKLPPFSTLDAKVTQIQTNLGTVSSNLGTVSSNLNTLSGNVVEISDVQEGEIFYRGPTGIAGVPAPEDDNTFLRYNDTGGFTWASAGTTYPTGVAFQSPDAASVWFFSSVSGIATSATESVAVTRSVFTGPRQVLYSTGSNAVTVTTASPTENHVLAVDSGGSAISFRSLTALPPFSTLDADLDIVSARVDTVSSNLASFSGTVTGTYMTTAAAEAAFVNIAGDAMTGRLDLQKGLSAASTCYYDDVVVFRDNTSGISSLDVYFDTSALINAIPGTFNSWLITTYPNNSTLRNADFKTNYAINLLDHWLYQHIVNFTNPEDEVQPGHWTLAGLRDRTVNLLSSTSVSALGDVSYSTTTNTTRHNYVLKWSSSLESWTPQQDVGGKLIGLYVGEDSAPEEIPDDLSLSGNIIVLAGNQEDLLVTEWDISSVIKHLSSTNGIEGSSIHHTLQELDQRYVLVGGDTMSGVLNASALSGVDYIEFDLTPTVDREEGRLYWNDDYKTLELDSANQTSMYLGQEVSIRVINNTGTTLNKGQVVYVSGVDTNVAAVALASASSEGTTHKGVGVLKQSLTTGSRGLMMMFGYLSGINTSGYSSGDILYLGTTPGAITTTYSPAPNHPELIGSVVNVGTSDSGSILVHVQHGYELQELHNVSRTEPSATGQILVWNETSSIYEPKYNYNTQAFVIENPSATEIPLFYAKHMNGIDEIHSYLIGASSPSVSWTLYTTSSVSNLTGATELVGDTTDDSSTGVTTAGTTIQNNGWVTLAIDGVIGTVSKLHLTIRTY